MYQGFWVQSNIVGTINFHAATSWSQEVNSNLQKSWLNRKRAKLTMFRQKKIERIKDIQTVVTLFSIYLHQKFQKSHSFFNQFPQSRLIGGKIGTTGSQSEADAQ